MTLKKKYTIEGLDCANCASKLEKAIGKIDGVEKATISFFSEKLNIEADEEKLDDIYREIVSLASQYKAKVK